ncbi:MAG: radical SAM/Cys-rich domain protein [Rhodothermales bacterium]|nr:radical SAM/Cys-rich domain protein [Rhodothermales bacterium]
MALKSRVDSDLIEIPTLDVDGPRRTTSLQERRSPLTVPDEQLRELDRLHLKIGPSQTGNFDEDLQVSGWSDFRPSSLDIFQINVGKLCNMTCAHCHVDSGPDRVSENMDRETIDECIDAIKRSGAHTVDLTGGAPELNPHFEYLVDACIDMGLHVIDRCNLTILTVNRFQHLPEWFAERGVEVVCSLPHYRRTGTDAQRGDGTYDKSIRALRSLNDAGYGLGHEDKILTLVTNPVGAFLAGSQSSLESEWQAALKKNHDVSFDRLLALNNMPMSRYLEWLLSRGHLETYMIKLVNAFNPATISGLMCRNTLSVNWEGYLFDCDFNQQLEMSLHLNGSTRPHVRDFDLEHWLAHEIRTERHCYGCTAGAGSGCGGAIT